MKRIYRWIRRPLVLILLLLVIIFLFKRLNIFHGWFTYKPLLIDNTPLVIKEIKSIAELNTATLYQDIVVDSIAPATIPYAAKREIVLIIKGEVTASIDLQNLADKDVFVKDDSVSISLPAATIRDVIINPSSIETFFEFGKWTNDEITALKLSARSKLLAEVAQKGLLQKADIKARSVIEQFLRAAQFKKIVVETKPVN